MRHRPDDPFSGRVYRSSDYPEVTVTDPTTDVPVERPNPLKRVTLILAPGMAAVSAVLTFLVSQGLVTQAVADAVNAVGGDVVTSVNGSVEATSSMPVWASVVSAALAAATAVVTSLAHSALARPKVTPVEDPRDRDGHKLVRVDGGLLGGRGNVAPLGGDR